MRASEIVSIVAGIVLLYVGIVIKTPLESFFQPILGSQVVDLAFNSTLIIGISILLIIVGTAVSVIPDKTKSA